MNKDFSKTVKRKRRNFILTIGLVALVTFGALVTLNTESRNYIKGLAGVEGEATIEITCEAVTDNPDSLKDKGVLEYLPKDGVIIKEKKVKFSYGETVYDVLDRTCREENIQMESTYTPVYKSYYVKGINYLYEKSTGKYSGWIYKVNDQMPSYGSSKYELKGGEKIKWEFTNGGEMEELGEDDEQ